MPTPTFVTKITVIQLLNTIGGQIIKFQNMTLRSRTYLSVSGMENHAEVTNLLGITPTHAWNNGDTYTINGRENFRRTTKWGFGFELYLDIDENMLYDQLFDLLAPHWDTLINLPVKYSKEIVLVHETTSCNADMVIFEHQIRLASEIKASWRLDVYSIEAETDAPAALAPGDY